MSHHLGRQPKRLDVEVVEERVEDEASREQDVAGDEQRYLEPATLSVFH